MITTVHPIMSRPNLVFPSKGSDSVMCAKFQMISTHYGQLVNPKDTTDEVPEGQIAEILKTV